MTEQIAKRDVVLPSEIMDISPTTPENGMSGYYLTPLIGAYFVHAPGKLIGEALQPRDSTVADFIRRGEEDQYLTMWRDEDYSRLGLVEKNTAEFSHNEQSSKVLELGVQQESNPISSVLRRKQAQGE